MGVALPERRTKNSLLLFGRVQWIYLFNRDAIPLLHLVHQVVGLGKKEFRIQGEQTEILAHPGSNIDQDHALGAESRRNRNCFPETVERPFQDLVGSAAFRDGLQISNFFLHAKGSSCPKPSNEMPPRANAASDPCCSVGTSAASSTKL